MLARLQANAAAAAADVVHGASQLNELRRAQRERWRAEQASSPAAVRTTVGETARTRLLGSSEATRARPGAAHSRDASARAETPRASQMNDRGDGVASRGFVFGAFAERRPARVPSRACRLAASLSRGARLRRRPRRRNAGGGARGAADAALAARLQREEQAAFARERASRARPRPPDPRRVRDPPRDLVRAVRRAPRHTDAELVSAAFFQDPGGRRAIPGRV